MQPPERHGLAESGHLAIGRVPRQLRVNFALFDWIQQYRQANGTRGGGGYSITWNACVPIGRNIAWRP